MISISKKLIILMLVIVMLFPNVYGIVSPTIEFYVNDYADLISDTTEQYIINVNTSLESQTGAQVVVVTVPNLGGDTLEEYATDLFRRFGIGDKSKNNGVLLLLALEERMFRIEVGYGLEGALNDSKTGRIQDEYIIPYLKENKWDEGIKNGFDAIIEEVCREYNVTVTSDKPVLVGDSQDTVFPYNTCIIIGLVSGIFFQIKKNKKEKLKWLVINVCGTGVAGLLSGIILSDLDNIFIVIIASIIMGLFSFGVTCLGASTSFRSGGGRSRGAFGGGGRSGGGGSSRRF